MLAAARLFLVKFTDFAQSLGPRGSENEVVDVTIESGAGRNAQPNGKDVPGKLMPLKKKAKLVAASPRREDDRVPTQLREEMCDGLSRDGSEETISVGGGHRRWEQPSDL